MKTRLIWAAVLFLFMSSSAGAASMKPVLYPNQHFKKVGQQNAQADIEECMRMAEEYGVSPDMDEELSRLAAQEAAVAAVAGATVAALLGVDPGEAAVIGAVEAGIETYTRGALEAQQRPGWVFRRFVERCLLEKGYEPIGWK